MAKTKKAPTLTADHHYILIRMKNGDKLRYHHDIRHDGWWTLGDDRSVDGRIAKTITNHYATYVSKGDYRGTDKWNAERALKGGGTEGHRRGGSHL